MIGRFVPFDNTRPDPSPRDGGAYRHHLLFSQRCASNAIEAGFRALTGRPLHPVFLMDPRTERTLWVSPETFREVPAPWPTT